MQDNINSRFYCRSVFKQIDIGNAVFKIHGIQWDNQGVIFFVCCGYQLNLCSVGNLPAILNIRLYLEHTGLRVHHNADFADRSGICPVVIINSNLLTEF